MQERRRFVRFQTRLPLSYTVQPQSPPLQTLTKYIGGGGVCFFGSTPIAAGTRLQAALTLPERPELAPFTAEVISCEQEHTRGSSGQRRTVAVDVRFIEIAPNDQADIMRHIMLSLQPPPPALPI